MKNNAEAAAELVRRTISLTGSDFALAEARNYLHGALGALNKTQKKREKRERNYQENERVRLISKQEAEMRLAYLDRMLRQEQLKLKTESDSSESA